MLSIDLLMFQISGVQTFQSGYYPCKYYEHILSVYILICKTSIVWTVYIYSHNYTVHCSSYNYTKQNIKCLKCIWRFWPLKLPYQYWSNWHKSGQKRNGGQNIFDFFSNSNNSNDKMSKYLAASSYRVRSLRLVSCWYSLSMNEFVILI